MRPRGRDREAWACRPRAAAVAVALVGALSAWARAADLPPQAAAPPPQAPAPGAALPAEARPPAPAEVKPAEAATKPPPPTTGGAQTPDESQRVEGILREENFDVARQVVKDFPGDTNAVGLMGIVHNQYGNTAEAAACWETCIEMDPGRADAYYGLAVIAQRKSEYPRAAELWRKAQELDPTQPGLYGHYAETLLDMGNPQEAIAAAQKELALNPANPEIRVFLGKAYLQLKEYDKAVAAYEKARQFRPRDSRPYLGLATAWARLGQADKAKEYSEQFRKIRDEKDKALVDSRRATDDRIDDRLWAAQFLAKTRTDAGGLYAAHGKLEKAEEHWRRAAAVDPGNITCRLGLVELYVRGGRERLALTFAEQLRAIDPKSATDHFRTGALLARLQQFDAAEEAVRKGLKAAPGRAAGYRALVEILLLRNQKLAEARALAGKLVELAPAALNYGMLSEACFRTGDLPGARAALERAMQLDPGNELIRSAYKRLQGEK